jgi:hypothetical protein
VNKFQKIGLAVVAMFGMSSAGDLWGPSTDDFPSLQVKVPDVVKCWSESNQTPAQGHPCYDGTGGWIFAYDYSGGSAEIKKEGTWVPFVSGTGLVNEADGSSQIDPDALRVKLIAKSEDGTKYGGSGIGFNFAPGNPVTGPNPLGSIKSKNGYCMTYVSDGALEWKLGHDEDAYSPDCTYEISLPAAASPRTVDVSWDDFVLPGWCKTSPPSNGPIPDKETVLAEPFSVKIAVPAQTSTTPNTVEFTLYEYGWKGTCGDNSPIIPVRANATGVKFSMAGKVLSLHVSKATSVQIINLQGALVHSQALVVANNTINLNSLPAGTYLVRIPALGYTSKILVK